MDAGAWDERYAASELVWSREPNVFVAAECADLPPGRAADLAAGEGRNALWLAERGWRVEAVDFSQVALDKGRRLADAGAPVDHPVTWTRADVTTWRGRDLDLVVVAYLQLPAEERRAVVRSALASLAPGGTLLWVAHDAINIAEGTGGPQDPQVLTTAEELLEDLRSDPATPAFAVVRAERVARRVAAAPDHHEHGGEPARTAWDCLLRVTRP